MSGVYCPHRADDTALIRINRKKMERNKAATTVSEHGGDVYRNKVELDFSVNLNPVPMPDEVRQAAMTGLLEMHKYPDPLHQRLREAIASYEGVSADDVICGSGASELLMAVCHAFRPRRALVNAPCYAGYACALNAVGAETEEYMLDEDGGFEADEEFLACLTDDTDMVFIADPNNPNGRLMDRDLKSMTAGICREKGITLVIDECFLPLTDRGGEGCDLSDGALHLRAFTKTFAVPGLRIGYMIGGDRGKLDEIRRHLPEWNMSCPAEHAGAAAAEVLRDSDYLERSNGLIRTEREYLRRELQNLGIRTYRSDTNFILFRAAKDLYDRLLEKGILIRSCANFSGLDETFFRIAVRMHDDNVRLISAIKELQ